MPETVTHPAGRQNIGVLVAVVGPSGVGKDSLINFASTHLSADRNILFVRRTITRPADAGSEDHLAMEEGAFLAAEASGAFAVTWTAHGLRYGIPVAARVHVAGGGVAVLNGSRAALGAIMKAFPRVQVIEITAQPDILMQRLGKRGRESEAAIRQRLVRRIDRYPGDDKAIIIDNSADLQAAGQRLMDILHGLAVDG